MKTLQVILFFSIALINHAQAQSVAIVAYNGANGDGYTIVAALDIPASTKFYFTDKEYISGATAFNADEGFWSYTTPAGGLTKGDVVTFTETGTSTNVLAMACSFGGGCGTFLNDSGGSINLAEITAEGVYAYSDGDADPENGVTTVHAVIYNWGTIPVGEDPSADFTGAFVVDGFASSGSHRDFKDASRVGATKAEVEDPSNYDTGTGNAALSTVAFTGDLSSLPVELQSFSID